VESKDERAAAELRRLTAETEKLVVEAEKLHAETRRFRYGVVMDATKLVLAVLAASIAALEFVKRLGWL